jgi:hypothetical protein
MCIVLCVLCDKEAPGVPLVVAAGGRMFSAEVIMSEIETFSDDRELVRPEVDRIVTLAAPTFAAPWP